MGIKSDFCNGRRDGLLISYANARYLGGVVFIELARFGFSGSTPGTAAEIARLIDALRRS